MSHWKQKPCKTCGRVGEWSMYCSDACKQKAYRKRKVERMLGNISGVSSMLIDLIGEEDALGVFYRLNQISGKVNQERAGQAIEQIIYSVQAKINHMIAESRD